jgi:cbb3-type cytochrome oxidase maturation protein
LEIKVVDVLFFLLPVSGVFSVIIVVALLWAVKSGQFDDLEGPAYRILMDEDETPSTIQKNKKVKNTNDNEEN